MERCLLLVRVIICSNSDHRRSAGLRDPRTSGMFTRSYRRDPQMVSMKELLCVCCLFVINKAWLYCGSMCLFLRLDLRLCQTALQFGDS